MLTDQGQQIVFETPNAVIVYCEAIFCNGFNVYKKTVVENGKQVAEKMNDRMSFFSSLEAAKRFLFEKFPEDKGC